MARGAAAICSLIKGDERDDSLPNLIDFPSSS